MRCWYVFHDQKTSGLLELTSCVKAIWDNRTVYHSAIFDYAGLGVRTGHRAVGIGEQPYFDANSLTRREALAKEADGGWEDF